MADEYTISPNNLDQLEGPVDNPDTRVLGGYVGRLAADIPALPTRMYGLASDVISAATKATVHQDSDSPVMTMARHALNYFTPALAARYAFGAGAELPGVEGAKEFTKSVDENADEFGSSIAGRPLQPGLIANNPTIDKIGTGIDILGSLIPITGGPIKTAVEGLKNINTGIKAIDKTVPAITEIASFLTPFVPTNSPKALIAVNAGLGGGLMVAADAVKNAQQPTQADDPELEAAIQGFRQQWAGVDQKLTQDAADGTDTATHGVGATFDAKKDVDLQHALEQFRGIDWTNPIAVETGKQHVLQAGTPDLGDYSTVAGAIAGIAVAAGVAFHQRAAINAKALEWIAGKDFSKAAKEDFVSKPNATNISAADALAAQTTDASIPVVRESVNPEVTRARFEKVASAWNVQSTSLHSDGTIANSSIRLNKSLDDTVRNFQALSADPPKLQLFRDAANAYSEMGNRVRAWLEDTKPSAVGTRRVDDPILMGEYTNWLAQNKQAVPPGTATTAAQLAAVESKYAFHSLDPATNTVVPFSDLLQSRRLAMADPVVGPLLNDFKDITKKVGLDYRLEKGLITKKEYSDLNNLHPNYFPVRIDGKHMSALDLSSRGGRLAQGDPIKELFPYIEETVKDVAHQELKRAFIQEVKDRASRGEPRAIELLGRDDVYSKNHYNKDKMIDYRDYKGNPRMIEVRDPLVRHSLAAGAGSAALRLNEGMLRVLAWPSRALEALTTGPLSTVVGAPFALGNFAYGSLATLINRPKGTVAGMLDKLVQDASGGKLGVRGDPTFYAQAAAQILPNVLAVLSKNGAAALESVVRSHSWASPAVGTGTLDALAKSMSNHYKASTLHALESQGLHGGATPAVRITAPTLQELENSLKPSSRASKGWQVTRNFVHDLYGAVGNAPQSAFYSQNEGRMSKGLLATRTRNVMGDPSKAGLATSTMGKAAVASTVLLPWGGVTLQSFSRFANSIKTNPAGTAMAIFNAVALPSMLITNWNASLGKEYSNYQYNVRTPDQVAGAHYVGIPGLPPEDGLEWRIDQLMRPFKVLTDMLYGHGIGLQDGSLFKPENSTLQAALADGMATRYGVFGGESMGSAMGQIAPAVPPVLNAAMAAMGFDQLGRTFTDPPSKIVDNKSAGATDSTSRVIDNKWFGYDVSARMEAVFNALGGQVGRGIYDTLTSAQQGTKDGLTTGDKIKDYGDRFMMNLDQSTREISGLWGHASTISPSQDASAKALQEEMGGLKKLDAASQKLRSLSGAGDTLVGAKGREIDALTGSGPVQFKDQQMYALAFDAQRFLSLYSRQYAGPIKDLYEQRTSIQSSEKVSPAVKQTLMNDVSKRIVEQNRAALGAVQQWKWNTSKAYGRDIDLRKIELDQPITQFKSLLPQ